MRPMEFSGVSLEFWNAKLKDIAMAEKFGFIHPPGATILYPAILLCTETRQFYIMELIGSTPSYTPLVEKRHKEPVIDRYFAQFDFEPSNAIMKLSGVDTGFANIGFQNEGVEEKLSARFPYLADRFKTWFVSGLESRGLIEIAPGAKFVFFEDCILVNDFSDAVRIKHLNMVIVVAKQTTKYDYTRYLTEHFAGPEVHGVAMVPPQREARGRQIAVQFANVFLTPNLRETTIGEFFPTHPEFVRRAFCSPRFVYEPYLEWQEGTAHESEKAINPDLIIQRSDGLFDIYDLKLPLLSRTDITQGGRARRRFIGTVAEGIAQLAHYEEYFSYAANRTHAQEKYGIRIENPTLGLIVGNEENFTEAHVQEASRSLRSPFQFSDYDTLLRLFLTSTC